MELVLIRELVEDFDLPVERTAIVEAYAIRDLLDVRIDVAVGAYEAAGLHDVDGCVTMTSWLRQEANRDPVTAGRCATRARKLRVLPVLRAAVLDGSLSGGQLDVIVANIPLRHIDLFAAHEPAVIPTLIDLTVDETRVVMEDWKRKADALNPGPLPSERDNQLHLSRTLDARGELRGSFDADNTAILEAALRVADPKDFDLTGPQRRAAALAQVCQHFLDHQHTRTAGRHRPHLNIVATYEEFCRSLGGTYLDTGQPVSPAALGVLRCDSAYHRLLTAGRSGILDYGRATRSWPADIYNAILARDQGCRWGTCAAPGSWCDVHHVQEWDAEDGTTSIENGAMFCRRHHHRGHTPGHHIKMLPDATIDITLPDGRTLTSQPRGPGSRPQAHWPEPPDSG